MFPCFTEEHLCVWLSPHIHLGQSQPVVSELLGCRSQRTSLQGLPLPHSGFVTMGTHFSTSPSPLFVVMGNISPHMNISCASENLVLSYIAVCMKSAHSVLQNTVKILVK